MSTSSRPIYSQHKMSDDRKASARGNGDGGRVFDAALRGLGSRWAPKSKPAQQNDNRQNNNGQKQEKKEGSLEQPKAERKKKKQQVHVEKQQHFLLLLR